ncbi:hypothetical protein, partial [Staphylococcus epidermidis]|uniref:hypothetical protein n=1 Tax=Staphylococcus epidermidis TaxID=1282 RepID=UPI0011A88D27
MGSRRKTVRVSVGNDEGTRSVDIGIRMYGRVRGKNRVRDEKGGKLRNGSEVYNYIIFENN